MGDTVGRRPDERDEPADDHVDGEAVDEPRAGHSRDGDGEDPSAEAVDTPRKTN